MSLKKCVIIRFDEAFSPSLKGIVKDYYKDVSEYVINKVYSQEFYNLLKKYYSEIKKGKVEILGVRYPFECEADFNFLKTFLTNASKTPKNLYYFPKARDDANINSVALFCLKEKITLDVFSLSLLQNEGKITQRAKEKMQKLMYDELGYNNIFRRFFPESRMLFEISPFWDEFKADEHTNYINLIDRVKHFYPAPKGVAIELHNLCNLKCSMCWYFSPIYQKMHDKETKEFFETKKEVDEKSIYEVLSFAGKYGLTAHFSAHGEPTIDKRLPDFMQFAKNAGAKRIALTTNATLLTKELSKKLLDSGLNRIYFSVDGAGAETYEKTRGFKLEKTEKNIKDFIELSKNYKEIETRFNCTMEGEAINEKEVFLDKWKDYENEIQSLNFTYVSVRSEDGLDYKPDISDENRDYSKICTDPWLTDLLIINALGHVYPSCNCPSQAKPVGGGGEFING